ILITRHSRATGGKIYMLRYKHLILQILFIGFSMETYAQVLFHQNVFYGGVTGAGFSTGLGTGSGSFNIYIEPGSSIKKAYLFSIIVVHPPPARITLTNINYLFDTTDAVISFGHKDTYAIPMILCVKDITHDISPIVSNYAVTIPSRNGLPINWGYWTA